MFNFKNNEISNFKVTKNHITSINITNSFLKNISYIQSISYIPLHSEHRYSEQKFLNNFFCIR